jgi:hypothetical protein
MRILKKEVQLAEALDCYDCENQGSASFDWARGYLAQKSHESGSNWTLVLLSKDEIPDIILPDHRHPRENPNVLIPNPGLRVSAAAARVNDVTQRTGECWENIRFHKERDFGAAHVFLQNRPEGLLNLDGLHRLLAWAVFEKTDDIQAYVLGLP